MSRKSSAGNVVSGKSRDRRNESSWYRALTIAIAVIAFGIGAYRFAGPAIFGIDVRIEPALTGVLISHDGVLTMPAEDIMIPYYTVTAAELLPSRPALKKINGLDSLKTLVGRFSEEDGGEVKVYAWNYRDPATKFVRLSTAEVTYILTPTDAEDFVEIVLAQIRK